MEKAAAVEALGLRKVYGNKVALENLTLSVGYGEVFGFLGPNGAGKTTAVKLLMGLVRPTQGAARVLGRPLGDREAKAQVGFLPEHFHFHDWLTAWEFLDLHGQLWGMDGDGRPARIREVLELVGLSDRAGDQLRTFSKGMLQRVGMAQALIHRPRLVFLDEPTSALDPLGRRDVREIIRRLKEEGVTVFLNSHLLSEVELVCNRVAIIDKGRVVREGALEELLREELELELRVENITPSLLSRLGELCLSVKANGTSITLRVDEEVKVPLVADAVMASGGRLYELRTKHISLEELFLSTVEGEER